MEQSNKKANSNISKNEALNLVRSFWLAFNNVNMYGTEHPTALNSAEKFYHLLKTILEITAPFTLHIEGGNLICEEWKMDEEIRAQRLVDRLNQTGITSVSFLESILQDDLMEFFKILMEARTFQTLDNIIKHMEEIDLQSIQLNYFVFQKVAIDEKLRSQKEDSIPETESTVLVETKRESTAEKLLDTFFQSESERALSMIEKLKTIRQRLESGSSMPLENVEEAVSQFKTAVEEDFTSEISVDVTPQEREAIFEELDAITVTLIGRNIYQALKAEDWPVTEIGNIIQRLEQELEQGGKIFPQIKDFLLKNSITLLQYMQFIHKLSQEMTAERFDSLLLKSKGHIGFSVQEIVKEMKRNPADIVSIATLGIELASLLGMDRLPIVKLFFQYTEKAIRNRVLTNLTGKEIEKSEEIESRIEETKQQLFKQLVENRMTKEILQEFDDLYQQRFPVLIGLIWAQILIDLALDRKHLPGVPGLKALAEKIKSNSEGKTILNHVLFLLEERGSSEEMLDSFIRMVTGITPAVKELKRHEKKDQRKIYRLPPGISSFRETKKYLDMEIHRNLRYNAPISCVSISVVSISFGEESRIPETRELYPIFVEITNLLKRSLRNLDFIGSLGSVKDNHIFIIMSMTGKEKSTSAVKRLREEVKAIRIEIEGKLMAPALVLSKMTFDPQETPVMRSFIRRLKAHHKKEVKRVNEIIGQ